VEILDKAERQQLIAFIEALVSDNIIEENDIQDFFNAKPLTENEKAIISKLKEKQELSLEEKKVISDAIGSKQNIKVKSLIKGKSAFIKFLVEWKLDTMFNVLWKSYPRKVGLQNGKKSFIKLFSEFKYKDIDIAFKQFKTRLKKYIYDCQGKDQQFILHFSTWINQKRWNDIE
jgi:hypothetical protein